MTREEEIKQAAMKEPRVALGSFQHAFKLGAEWADRTMIDRVYDWLDFYLATAVVEWDEELTKQSFLDELMRKMKGGVG